jgi:signal transduction histidine kinase
VDRVNASSASGRVLIRPVRASTWRELAYLLLGGPASIVAFVVFVTGVSVGLGMLVTLVGIPILFATAYAFRGISWLERRRAALVLRSRIDEGYRQPPRPGVLQRAKTVALDPQTWKDAGWMIVLSVVGFASWIVALVAWSISLWALTLPLYWWALPDGSIEVGNGHEVQKWWEIAVIAVIGAVLVVGATWLCAGLARGQALAARFFLAPGAQERVEELERSRAAVVRAEEEERRRLERDLHDGVQARLVALALDLGMARDKLDGGDTDAARELVGEAHDEAKQTLATLRELVRGVHPAILADRGLDAALSALAARSPVPVEVDVEAVRLPAEVESAAYFVVAEALANVAKHSGATHCDVRIRVRDGNVLVEISDDGVGGARIGAGSGLSGLADRVEALDGSLRVASPEGGPTVVVGEIPCAS